MVFLYFRNDKRLILTRTTDTYVNENKFEIIKITCEKVIDGYNIENTTVQLNVIPPHGQAVDIINLDLIQDENVDSRLSTEIKIPIEYLQMSGDLKFQIKVYDNEIIGKSNIALFEIVNTVEVENFLSDNQLTMLDQYVTRFENIASELDKQLEENKNFPVIGTSIGKENKNWWIWDINNKEYIDTNVLATATISMSKFKFKINENGILQVEYDDEEQKQIVDLGNVVGSKGDKGDKGDNGVDGISPTVELNKVDNTTTLSITDKRGTKTVNILDGEKGSDYVLTDSDKQEISQLTKNTVKTRIVQPLDRNTDYYVGELTSGDLIFYINKDTTVGDTIYINFKSGETATTLSSSGCIGLEQFVPKANSICEIHAVFNGTNWVCLTSQTEVTE